MIMHVYLTVIGASLSEPHTSGACVYAYDQPCTENLNWIYEHTCTFQICARFKACRSSAS